MPDTHLIGLLPTKTHGYRLGYYANDAEYRADGADFLVFEDK